MTATSHNILSLDDMSIDVTIDGRIYRAVSSVSLDVSTGGTLAIVGESGSGKSLTLRSIAGLLPPNASMAEGEMVYDGRHITDQAGHSELLGSEIGIVFQDASRYLSPVKRVWRQISDAARTHRGLSRSQAKQLAIELLDRVRIPRASATADMYPFELSGGMRQRVMIASAVALNPRLLLCDEPTSALDVTVQASIIELLRELVDDLDTGLVFVTHDLSIAQALCSDVVVFFGGEIVESGSLDQVFNDPGHEYTQGLLLANPRASDPTKPRPPRLRQPSLMSREVL